MASYLLSVAINADRSEGICPYGKMILEMCIGRFAAFAGGVR
jgi:hypothetical protein